MKRVIYIFSVVALLGCARSSQESGEVGALPVRVQVMDSLIQLSAHHYIGQLEEVTRVDLSFPSGGRLTHLYVHKGSRVSQGQLLAEVDKTEAESLLETARAKLRQAEDGYSRAQQVHSQGGLTEVKWVEVETQLSEARSTVKGLEKRLTDCSLYAPMAGIVSDCQVSCGENVGPGQSVLTFLDMSGMHAVFTVPEQDINSIGLGDSATMIIPALEHCALTGIVYEKSLTAQPLSHTYAVRVLIHEKNTQLLPGMVAHIRLASQDVQGYMLPANCVYLSTEGEMVWTVREGKAVRSRVEIGAYVNNQVLIRTGLSKGDQVIVSGQHKLYSGASVRVMP